MTLQRFRSLVETHGGPPSVDPEDVWELGRALPYEFQLKLSLDRADGGFDIFCRPIVAGAPTWARRQLTTNDALTTCEEVRL